MYLYKTRRRHQKAAVRKQSANPTALSRTLYYTSVGEDEWNTFQFQTPTNVGLRFAADNTLCACVAIRHIQQQV